MARSRLLVCFVVVAAGLLAGPASADLLVTRDGGTVETRGQWEVKGKVVFFTGLDGRLRSLRVVDLDLAESERRTRVAAEMRRSRESRRAAAAGTATTEPATRKAVLVLTDADVRHVPTASGAVSDSSGKEAGEGRVVGDRDSDGRPALRVSDWSENVGVDGVEISGTLQNDSDGLVAGISLTIDLLGDDGSVVESAAARVDRRSLAAGESSHFAASFRSFFVVREPEFRPRGSLLARTQTDTDSPAGRSVGLP